MLDPFLPEKSGDVERLSALQRESTRSFKALVRAPRGALLKGDDDALLSGEVFTGRRALDMGLIDGIGDLRGVLRDRFGDKVYMPLITPERGFLGRRAFGIGPNGLMGAEFMPLPRPRGRHDFGA